MFQTRGKIPFFDDTATLPAIVVRLFAMFHLRIKSLRNHTIILNPE